MKNQHIGGEMPKMGDWIVFRFKRWLGKKEGVDVFKVELRPQCRSVFIDTNIQTNNIVTQ